MSKASFTFMFKQVLNYSTVLIGDNQAESFLIVCACAVMLKYYLCVCVYLYVR